MYDEKNLIKNERNEPEPIVYYNYMKGGVDIVDLLSTMASIKVKAKRWSNIVLSSFLKLEETNGGTLFNKCNEKYISNLEFNGRLGKALVIPFIQQWYANSIGLHISVIHPFIVNT